MFYLILTDTTKFLIINEEIFIINTFCFNTILNYFNLLYNLNFKINDDLIFFDVFKKLCIYSQCKSIFSFKIFTPIVNELWILCKFNFISFYFY